MLRWISKLSVARRSESICAAGDDRVSPLVAEIGRQAALELVRSDAEQRVMAVLADAGTVVDNHVVADIGGKHASTCGNRTMTTDLHMGTNDRARANCGID